MFKFLSFSGIGGSFGGSLSGNLGGNFGFGISRGSQDNGGGNYGLQLFGNTNFGLSGAGHFANAGHFTGGFYNPPIFGGFPRPDSPEHRNSQESAEGTDRSLELMKPEISQETFDITDEKLDSPETFEPSTEVFDSPEILDDGPETVDTSLEIFDDSQEISANAPEIFGHTPESTVGQNFPLPTPEQTNGDGNIDLRGQPEEKKRFSKVRKIFGKIKSWFG